MMFTYCPSCGQKGTVQKLDDTNYECANCKWHYWNNAKPATAMVFIKDGLVMFGKRAIDPAKGKYDLPGGFVDFGEGGYEGAIREAREELGVHINKKDLELLDIYTYNYNPTVTTVDLVFLVHKWDGELTPKEEVTAIEWKPASFLENPSFMQAGFYPGLGALLASKIPGLKQ
ncbi:MAG TPA: NUDIX domain-containing protein [Candidatus Saccharimonadales bacterium]|nr:NUDIX domain-containing protein [Candidatus Saccharimonadales bacterium]